VNLAQRLEGLDKQFATDCLISGPTFEAARSNCADAVAMRVVQVRGRESPVEVFALGGQTRRSSAS
jgi:class 3 adenylate cyclase